MRARYRLGAYAVLWVVSLLAVPLLLPPARDPTYGPPPVAASYGWAYGPSVTYAGTPIPGQGSLTVTLNFSGPVGSASEHWNFSAQGGVASRWPIASWLLLRTNGSLLALSWTCASGRGWANLTHAVPNGLAFPLGASFEDQRASPASLAGPCVPSGKSAGVVSTQGGYQRVVPPGGSVSCVLYLCNSVREYQASWSLSILAPTTPSGPAVSLALWSLQGLYDPAISGYRFLSVSPGPSGSYVNGSLNLSGTALGAQPTPSSPAPEVEFLDSVGLLLAVPVSAALVEGLTYRHATRKAERETEREVMAALTPEEVRKVPPGEVFDNTMDESETTPPG